MALSAIAYASEAIPGLSMDRVDDLSRAGAAFNLRAGVTGVLLYDGMRFVQYLEGPDDSINVVYGRVLAATSHREIVELGRSIITTRFFPYWSMRLLTTEPEEVRDVVRADWYQLSPRGAIGRLSEVVSPYVAT